MRRVVFAKSQDSRGELLFPAVVASTVDAKDATQLTSEETRGRRSRTSSRKRANCITKDKDCWIQMTRNLCWAMNTTDGTKPEMTSGS